MNKNQHQKNHNKHHNKKNKSSRRSQTDQEDDKGADKRYKVQKNEIMGRYITALRQFQPGDIILSEPPLIVGPCTNAKLQCIGCYHPLSSPPPTCPSCAWPLCSPTCPGVDQPLGHPSYECAALSHSTKQMNYSTSAGVSELFNLLVPLRCLLTKKHRPDVHAILMDMETHNEIRKNRKQLWQNNQENIVDRLRHQLGLDSYTEEEIHTVCGILEVNSFEIGHNDVNIRGVYHTARLLSHDCVPNTNHIDSARTFELTIRASTAIAPNTPITVSYAHTLQSTLKRRQHLVDNKFFWCQCRRCADPTELGTFCGALLCPKCSGHVLSTAPLEMDADWACKKCAYTVSGKAVAALTDKIQQESDDIDSNDVAKLEEFLHRYRNVLHPHHYLCLNVKLTLSQVYGKIAGWLIHELDEEKLRRKHEICEEILRVFNVIEPGYTRLRGVTLYEMHAPLMILLTRQFETHSSKNGVKSKLRRILACLREASVILGFEPEDSAEGMMGVAAKDALAKIGEWEGMLGRL